VLFRSNAIVVVLIMCAGALAFVVLYNLTNINVLERKREIATIKVLGFFDREVTAYIYRETGLLTLIGCAVGLGLGIFMHAFVIQTVEVDNVMFARNIMPLSFLWSTLLTLAFSVVVDIVMSWKLRHIGMADNLKSVD
jgi:putative ABC transport system permease protein